MSPLMDFIFNLISNFEGSLQKDQIERCMSLGEGNRQWKRLVVIRMKIMELI